LQLPSRNPTGDPRQLQVAAVAATAQQHQHW